MRGRGTVEGGPRHVRTPGQGPPAATREGAVRPAASGARDRRATGRKLLEPVRSRRWTHRASADFCPPGGLGLNILSGRQPPLSSWLLLWAGTSGWRGARRAKPASWRSSRRSTSRIETGCGKESSTAIRDLQGRLASTEHGVPRFLSPPGEPERRRRWFRRQPSCWPRDSSGARGSSRGFQSPDGVKCRLACSCRWPVRHRRGTAPCCSMPKAKNAGPLRSCTPPVHPPLSP